MSHCLHEFVRIGRWPTPKNRRYHCRLCGMLTRSYDSVDQMAMRPIHRRMSVAFRPMNVVSRNGWVPNCAHNLVTVTVPAGYELVKVGEVPPWMRLVERDAQQFGHDLYILRGES